MAVEDQVSQIVREIRDPTIKSFISGGFIGGRPGLNNSINWSYIDISLYQDMDMGAEEDHTEIMEESEVSS